MNKLRTFTIYGNRHRWEYLTKFRNEVERYFNGIRREFGLDEPIENEDAVDARREINIRLSIAIEYVADAGVPSTYTYTPPAMVGGNRQNVEVLLNVFLIHRFQMNPNVIIDVLDRAIGVYEADKTRAWIRTFNPLFWLLRVISLVAGIPFYILTYFGFEESIEYSLIGRMFKFCTEIVLLAAAVVTVLNFFNEPKNAISIDSIKIFLGL